MLCCPPLTGADPDDDNCWSGYSECPATLRPVDVVCLPCADGHVGWHSNIPSLPSKWECDGLAVNADDDYSVIDNDCDLSLVHACEDCPQENDAYKCNGVGNPDQDCQAWSGGIEFSQYQPLCCQGLASPTICYPVGENTGSCSVGFELYTCEAMWLGSDDCPGWKLRSADDEVEERAYDATNCIVDDGCYRMQYQCLGTLWTYPDHEYVGDAVNPAGCVL